MSVRGTGGASGVAYNAQNFGYGQATLAQQLAYGNVVAATVPADPTRQGGWFFQNQKQQAAGSALLVLDDGASAATDGSDPTRSVFIVDGPATTGQQGGSLGSADLGLHQGRLRVLVGSASAQFGLRTW